MFPNNGDHHQQNRTTEPDPLRPDYADFEPESNPGSRRESFMDSDLEMRKYQGLSASGVAGYQAVGGDASEPGSPTQNEGYERSHESGSSGTKVESGSVSRAARPETMSSDGSYDHRQSGMGHVRLIALNFCPVFADLETPSPQTVNITMVSILETMARDTSTRRCTTHHLRLRTLVDIAKARLVTVPESNLAARPRSAQTTCTPTSLTTRRASR